MAIKRIQEIICDTVDGGKRFVKCRENTDRKHQRKILSRHQQIMRARTISGQFGLFSMGVVDICAFDAARLRATTLPNAHTAVVGFFNCTSSRVFYTFSCVCCVITKNSAGRIVYSIVTSAFSSQLRNL